MLRTQFFFLFLFATGISIGCNSYEAKNSSDSGVGNSSSSEPVFIVPTFAFVQSQVLQPYCLSCHSNVGGNPDGVNLETYENTFANIANIENVALVSQIMPPSHALPAFAQTVLSQWINGGAPENGTPDPTGGPTPAPSPDPKPVPSPGPGPSPAPITVQPTYTSLAQNIFTPKCIVCHSATGSQSSRPLDSYQGVLNFVTTKNASGSILFQEINTGKMPPNGPLSQNEIQAVSTWITNGAQNN